MHARLCKNEKVFSRNAREMARHRVGRTSLWLVGQAPMRVVELYMARPSASAMLVTPAVVEKPAAVSAGGSE